MSISVNNLILKVRQELHDQDSDNYRWETSELIGWLDSGLKAAVVHKPDIYVVSNAVQLASGTKQALPTGGIQLIDIIRNMGAAGSTPGASISIIGRKILDQMTPNWHSSASNATVKHYIFDERFPKIYYVYPPNTGTYVEIVYGSTPATPVEDGSIALDEIWEPTLIDYVIYRAMMKDTENANNFQIATEHFKAFLLSLGARTAAEALYDPNRMRVGV